MIVIVLAPRQALCKFICRVTKGKGKNDASGVQQRTPSLFLEQNEALERERKVQQSLLWIF